MLLAKIFAETHNFYCPQFSKEIAYIRYFKLKDNN